MSYQWSDEFLFPTTQEESSSTYQSSYLLPQPGLPGSDFTSHEIPNIWDDFTQLENEASQQSFSSAATYHHGHPTTQVDRNIITYGASQSSTLEYIGWQNNFQAGPYHFSDVATHNSSLGYPDTELESLSMVDPSVPSPFYSDSPPFNLTFQDDNSPIDSGLATYSPTTSSLCSESPVTFSALSTPFGSFQSNFSDRRPRVQVHSSVTSSPRTRSSQSPGPSRSHLPHISSRLAVTARPTIDDSQARGPVSGPWSLPSYTEELTCDQCSKPFRRSCDLRKHVKTHEKGLEREFSCDYCSSRFYYGKDLARHKRSVHRDEHSSSAHQCSICKKEFIRSDKLRRHQRTHDSGFRSTESSSNEFYS